MKSRRFGNDRNKRVTPTDGVRIEVDNLRTSYYGTRFFVNESPSRKGRRLTGFGKDVEDGTCRETLGVPSPNDSLELQIGHRLVSGFWTLKISQKSFRRLRKSRREDRWGRLRILELG